MQTRRGIIFGNSVKFQRLSKTAKVEEIWNTVWHDIYDCERDALLAKYGWEKKAKIFLPKEIMRGDLDEVYDRPIFQGEMRV